MPYVDPQTVHNPATGAVIPASWGDTVRDDLEFLVERPSFAGYYSTPGVPGPGPVPVANATATAMPMNAEYYDTASLHSTSTNNTRVTASVAGRWTFTATVQFDQNPTGVRRGAFRVNGSTIYESMQVPAVSTLRSCVITCIRSIELSAGDYVELLTEQTSGDDLAVVVYEFAAKWESR